MTYKEKIAQATDYLKKQGIEKPQFALILGSGLGELAEEIQNPIIVEYSTIPHFPVSTVAGHSNELVYGELSGKKVLVMKGRFHYYEGYALDAITFPIRVFKALGIDSVFLTNAAGGVNETFKPGTLMMITDHINYAGPNPLIGANDEEIGPRFPDMTKVYTPEYQTIIRQAAKEVGVDLKEGVYTWYSGPSYETPAEIRMFRLLGTDAIGMSTVPEAIVARHAGMKVMGISCITNLAAGMSGNALSHEEVVEVTQKVKHLFKDLVKKTLELA
ncbi:purine-nucleoside phosphorylase [Granulicatella sp. zg-ZJ]|uniref:purine-nucleoside phosphorylase n=1 Tax=unclassified Granulicatella TaxID=2630493 RepID=UPI0013C261E0|nr:MULTISPECIES: purine-nucleoside phosphorylase [unclassified Granulicatella]NEW63394.1 purine-nucleoside phosphorylase [Granulicatella sp. zg-ZJ]NEW65494.1 purine-nucleoside phosphorylase [Granulicatella sp. zg-84]QMI85284.1 purine-nucleoside phosphorylase [Carnobacteriaceae bacterium zg-84]